MQKRKSKLLSIDPGMNTGWASWGISNKPESSGIFRVQRKVLTEYKRLVFLWDEYSTLLLLIKPNHVAIESASTWGMSKKSLVSTMAGSLDILNRLIGGYLALTNEVLPRAEVELISPQRWKGQLTEVALRSIIQKVLKDNQYYRQHELEAVGLGYFVRRKLK